MMPKPTDCWVSSVGRCQLNYPPTFSPTQLHGIYDLNAISQLLIPETSPQIPWQNAQDTQWDEVWHFFLPEMQLEFLTFRGGEICLYAFWERKNSLFIISCCQPKIVFWGGSFIAEMVSGWKNANRKLRFCFCKNRWQKGRTEGWLLFLGKQEVW